MPEKSPDQIAIEQMSHADVTALALGFLEQIKVMNIAIGQLQQELWEIKSRLGKDSHNSSKRLMPQKAMLMPSELLFFLTSFLFPHTT